MKFTANCYRFRKSVQLIPFLNLHLELFDGKNWLTLSFTWLQFEACIEIEFKKVFW